jgi:hypothetical protein
MSKHTAQYMSDGASAQIEIIETIDGNVERYKRTLAIATFYWEAEQDWPVFVAQVASVADRMFAEFNNEIEDNVTQYIQFKTGGVL